MTAPTQSPAEFAAGVDRLLKSRSDAIAAGGVTRNDRGQWVNPDLCEVVGTDGLDMSLGQAALVYTGETPWHGMGTYVAEAPDAETALRLGGLDWTAELRRSFFAGFADYQDENGEWTKPKFGDGDMGETFAVVRTDTNVPLTRNGRTVGRTYVPIQNHEAFAFLSDLMGLTRGEARFETAGALDNGRRVFVSMLLPDDVVLDAEGAHDVIKQYIMAVNGFDGTSSFSVAATPIRPVCKNTVAYATQGAQARWTVQHSKGATGRFEDARKSLGLSIKYYKRFAEDAKAMFETPMSNQAFDALLADLFPVDDDAKPFVRERAESKQDEARDLFRNAPTQANIRNTLWGAEQALLEQMDWRSTVRVPKTLTEANVRAAKIVEGTNDTKKTELHARLLTLVNR